MRGLLGAAGSMLAFILSLAVAGFYLVAFFEGAGVWFGWHGWWVGALAPIVMIFLGPVGTIFIAVVGGYGAHYGWHWHWVLCLVAFFPGLAALVGYALMSGVGAIFSRRRDAL